MRRRYSYTFLGQRLRRLDDRKHGHIAIHNTRIVYPMKACFDALEN